VDPNEFPTANDRFQPLLHLMSTLEVPSARPNFSRRDEALGLTLLSLALRLRHVVRVTENLTLTNTDHLTRTVSVDVDMQYLTARQKRVVSASEAGPEQLSTPTGSKAVHELWVPIARHSRDDLAPVIVRNGSGDAVPRLRRGAHTTLSKPSCVTSFV
jgi:hypothetical protein